MGVPRAARMTRHAALDPPARARCLTRHPRLRRRSLACACHHNMVRFVARKERMHATPITVQARRQRGLEPLGLPVLGVRHHRTVVIAAPRGIAEGPSRCLTRGRARSSSPMVLVSDTPAPIRVHADPLGMVPRVLHADRKRATLPDMKASLTTLHCSTVFCWQVADRLAGLPSPPRRTAGPVRCALGVRHARTGVGNRALDRWVTRDDRARCPQLQCP